MTGLDIIKSAMRLAGVLASGESLDAAEQQDALMIANQMLDSWNAERLMAFSITIGEYSLTAGIATYTLGPGGTFNAPRPAKIERVSIVSLNNPNQPLELPIDYYTDRDWSQVPVKNVEGALPTGVYDDGNYPFRNLTYWTIPNVPVKTRIYSWQALTQFPNLVSSVTFPPGYFKAIRYNLAVELFPEFSDAGAQLSAITVQQAIQSKAILKTINSPTIQSTPDPAVCSSAGSHYNYYSDTAAPNPKY